MKKRLYFIGIILFFLVFITWRFIASKERISGQVDHRSEANANSTSNKSVSSNRPDLSSLSPKNYPGGLPPVKDFVDPKVAKIVAIMASENAQAQDFYGKVVDQYGKPVIGATALGTLLWVQGIDIGEKREQHTTQTDQNGEFQFTGFHASRLAVAITKEGYEMGRAAGVYTAPNEQDKTSATERAIFHMWKLRGAEPMIAYAISTAIPCDGTPTSYDLLTGKKVTAGGDLIIKLVRNPVNINRSKPFDWSVTLAIPSGGLQEINDLYPNEAPADGYQPSVTINMSPEMKNWQAALTHSFYFKSENGQDYGRMTINIQADFQPPPTYFGADIYINPSGSRNLEFDRTKQIRLK
ncbi:MAG TPA: carboxypeptidase-like regulatory domain-containing protein [Opitutaceae bacterium]|nr:carboxypeptidase-like regulatory domain-containing protein [Opitutaceae bacterium]